LETALLFAKEGAQVTLSDINETAGKIFRIDARILIFRSDSFKEGSSIVDGCRILFKGHFCSVQCSQGRGSESLGRGHGKGFWYVRPRSISSLS
jgi:hypothetical protein